MLTGNAGSNVLSGHDGADMLTSGEGDDLFRFDSGDDTITDFTDGEDRFDLRCQVPPRKRAGR